jgi:hypothetical protein
MRSRQPWSGPSRVGSILSGGLARCLIAIALIATIRPVSSAAQEAQPLETTEAPRGPGDELEAAEELHPNELALVLVGTWKEREDRSFFTAGVEYERRLMRVIGAGAELEYVTDADAWLLVFPVTLHPAGGLKIFGGPGFERSVAEVEEHERSSEEHGEGPRENHLLWRIGAGYAFEFAERYAVTPAVSVDFVRESGSWARAVVYGMSFGIGF